jgi:hypothetical protein
VDNQSFGLVKFLVLISVIVAGLLSVLEFFHSGNLLIEKNGEQVSKKKVNISFFSREIIDSDLKKLIKIRAELQNTKSELEKWKLLVKFIFE